MDQELEMKKYALEKSLELARLRGAREIPDAENIIRAAKVMLQFLAFPWNPGTNLVQENLPTPPITPQG